MLIKQKGDVWSPRDKLNNALLTLIFLNVNETGSTAAEKYWILARAARLKQPIYYKHMLISECKSGNVLH